MVTLLPHASPLVMVIDPASDRAALVVKTAFSLQVLSSEIDWPATRLPDMASLPRRAMALLPLPVYTSDASSSTTGRLPEALPLPWVNVPPVWFKTPVPVWVSVPPVSLVNEAPLERLSAWPLAMVMAPLLSRVVP